MYQRLDVTICYYNFPIALWYYLVECYNMNLAISHGNQHITDSWKFSKRPCSLSTYVFLQTDRYYKFRKNFQQNNCHKEYGFDQSQFLIPANFSRGVLHYSSFKESAITYWWWRDWTGYYMQSEENCGHDRCQKKCQSRK